MSAVYHLKQTGGKHLLKSSTLQFISRSVRKSAEVLLGAEEVAVLPEQTELKLSDFLLVADGGRNEKLMGKKSLPTCLFSPLKPKRKTF